MGKRINAKIEEHVSRALGERHDVMLGQTGIHATHVFAADDSDIDCVHCGLPRANQRHYTKAVIRNQVEVALLEQIASRDKAIEMCQALGWTSLRLAVQIVNEDARYVGVNVTEGYDHGHTFEVIDYAGLRYANGDDVVWRQTDDDDRKGEAIDVSELDENVWLIIAPMQLEEDDQRTYWFDLNVADVNQAMVDYDTAEDFTPPGS